MAWMRLHDGALSHPKLVGLFDPTDPFHLWIWGLSYSQQHLTDGLLPGEAIPKGTKKAVAELVRRRLWHEHEMGFTIHDYLDWNDSKELVTKKRSEAKSRMSRVRANSSPEQSPNTPQRTSREVLRGVGNKNVLEEKERDVFARAGRLIERYQALYAEHRNGARLRIIANPLQFDESVSLCQLWDDAHLEKLAILVLTTNDDWIAGTDRGFKIFAAKASWADDKLKAWEATHKVSA